AGASALPRHRPQWKEHRGRTRPPKVAASVASLLPCLRRRPPRAPALAWRPPPSMAPKYRGERTRFGAALHSLEPRIGWRQHRASSRHLAEKGGNNRRTADAFDQNHSDILADFPQRGLVLRILHGEHAGQSFEERAGEDAREGVRLRTERRRRRHGRKRVGVPVEESIHRIAQAVGL